MGGKLLPIGKVVTPSGAIDGPFCRGKGDCGRLYTAGLVPRAWLSDSYLWDAGVERSDRRARNLEIA